jgi:hypothetical protein
MLARIAALSAVLVAGCAGSQRNAQVDTLSRSNTGLFVGHSTQGDVVLAASHYDAMTGLATTDQDLGLSARKNGEGQMLCQREMPTGTHVPRWACRYEDDIRDQRQAARDWLDRPHLSYAGRTALPMMSMGRGPGGGSKGSLTP